MTEFLNPKSVHKPAGAYSHSAKIPANAELLMIAGQVGVDPKGKLQTGIRNQSEQAFRNILAIVRENGMQKRHLVKFTVYLTDPRDIEAYRAARKKIIGDAILPPSTLLIIDGLASPDMLIEIEAMAAKA
jgi:enamine deaminase RidA (YjgF/YER057c/UK114 family)